MADNPEYEFKKLNDILVSSFANVKFDVRDINGRMESFRKEMAQMSINSLHKVLEDQMKLNSELKKAVDNCNFRIKSLEDSKSSDFKAPTMVLQKKAVKKASIYDIPKGEARITKVQFVAPGGRKNLNGEWIEITGYDVDLSAFKLFDEGRKHVSTFPKGFKIYGPIKVFTGKGKDTPTKLYWKNSRPIWNDDGDVATLVDKKGKIASKVASKPEMVFKVMR